MIAHLEDLIKTNNFVPHQFCSKTNITPPGVENQGQMGQFWENEDIDQVQKYYFFISPPILTYDSSFERSH